MATGPLYFGPSLESGDSELAGAPPLCINVVSDGKGAVRRRPCFTGFEGLFVVRPITGPLLGLAVFENELYCVASNRGIYKFDGVGTWTYLNLLLEGDERPTFAVTQFRLVIAGGGAMAQVESGATSATLLGGSPPPASQVVALASRLFCNDLTDASTAGRIRFSRTGDAGEENWDPLDFVGSEARPDAILALRENANELFAWGTSTLQVFSPDPNTILAPGRAINRGISAPHSIIAKNDTFVWLDEQKQFVTFDGRTDNVVSDAIAGTIDSIDVEDLADCFGFWLNQGQVSVLVWNFPDDGRAFALQTAGGWAQWQAWETTAANYVPLPISAHVYWPERDLQVVASTDGDVGTMSLDNATDLGGRRVKVETKTGFINRGTDQPKHCQMVRFTFKRGEAAPKTPGAHDSGVVSLSWRDDTGDFCNPVDLSLGNIPDYVFTLEVRGLGVYRARQWRIEFTNDVPLLLARAEEVYDDGGAN